MYRTKYILGNWKLNKNQSDISRFFTKFNKDLQKNKTLITNKDIVFGFAPTFLGLSLANKLIKKPTILMAQDVSENLHGSFTGQISCQQLKDLKVKWSIVGHSETRKYLGCTDKIVNKKVLTCLVNNIKPVICIGESLTQYNNKQTKQVLTKQIKTIFNKFKGVDIAKCVIAYEPLWAIGSGKTPTLKEINNLCGYIKKCVNNKAPILYGGSVNENNALSICSLRNVAGLLIGGASLYPDKFIKILKDINSWQRKK